MEDHAGTPAPNSPLFTPDAVAAWTCAIKVGVDPVVTDMSMPDFPKKTQFRFIVAGMVKFCAWELL